MITIKETVYDGVVFKPDLDEAVEHFGIKGMKWRKYLKRKYDKAKSNLQKKGTKLLKSISFLRDLSNTSKSEQKRNDGSINNRPGSRKKRVLSGTTSVKKRGVAK